MQVSGLDTASDAGVVKAQVLMRILQRVVYTAEGGINKFLVDDKGLLVLVGFGLPPMVHNDDALRAVLTAQRIIRETEVPSPPRPPHTIKHSASPRLRLSRSLPSSSWGGLCAHTLYVYALRSSLWGVRRRIVVCRGVWKDRATRHAPRTCDAKVIELASRCARARTLIVAAEFGRAPEARAKTSAGPEQDRRCL